MSHFSMESSLPSRLPSWRGRFITARIDHAEKAHPVFRRSEPEVRGRAPFVALIVEHRHAPAVGAVMTKFRAVESGENVCKFIWIVHDLDIVKALSINQSSNQATRITMMRTNPAVCSPIRQSIMEHRYEAVRIQSTNQRLTAMLISDHLTEHLPKFLITKLLNDQTNQPN